MADYKNKHPLRKLGHMDKSALADHGWKTGHSILFDRTELLCRSDQWGPRVTQESLELLLTQRALNKDDGIKLRAAWLPAYEVLKNRDIILQAPLLLREQVQDTTGSINML